MTISSSLKASVAGLAANASRLATISDNIANSSTNGYKRREAEFQSMVLAQTKGVYTAGGVRVTTQRLIDQQGALLGTTNSTDIAVRGRGFIPVTKATSVTAGETPLLLTTTGSFRPDDEGILTTPSGVVLLGWPANADGTIPVNPRDSSDGLVPVQINANQFAGEATTRMSLGVNLPATSTEFGSAGAAESLSVEYFDNLGTSQTLTATFTPSVPANPGDPATNQWRMVLRDGASGDAIVGVYDLQFDDSRAAGGTLLAVTQPDVDATGADAAPPAGGPIGGGYADGNLAIDVAGGPIDISIGEIGSAGGFTQLSDSFAPTEISKNGAPVGNLVSVEIDPNGSVNAIFDTGIVRRIYQVPLVDMANPNGLNALDVQTYSISSESGPFFLWDAGDGPAGEIIGFALEQSTVDVAGELTQLIETQRAYSSNAKVIQTVDEMLQETTNIKR